MKPRTDAVCSDKSSFVQHVIKRMTTSLQENEMIITILSMALSDQLLKSCLYRAHTDNRIHRSMQNQRGWKFTEIRFVRIPRCVIIFGWSKKHFPVGV